MKTGRILIVEDDFDISNLLRIFFDGEGYDLDELPQPPTSLDG
jgi:DNA-binding response OmpR family regulator